MTEHWKKLLPVDRYIVRSNSLIHNFDRKILTLLYQPLIGPLCYSLYMTLWSELELDRLWGDEKTHHYLMRIMQSDLSVIFNERKKLEGIGLLKTFIRKQNDSRSFIYELQAPLDPKQFFDDGVLNVYLYNRIGKTHFNRLKKFFSAEIIETDEYEPVTHSFQEVFSSLHPSELKAGNHPEMVSSLSNDQNSEYMSKMKSHSFTIENDDFDFDFFTAGLSETMLPKKSLTPQIKEVIVKLAYVYRINPMEMRDLVLQSMDPSTEKIEVERLRKAARDWYQFEHDGQLPSLSMRTQPGQARTMGSNKPKNKEEELMQKLEIVSPYQFLKEISGGAEPSANDLQMIEEIMLNQKLNPGVINVLIYYVMLKSDMKLSKNYVTKIASHWTRKQVQTVPEAMNLAKSEHRQYQDWAEKKKSKTLRKPIREEKLPDWLKQQKVNEKDTDNEPKKETTDDLKQFEELIKTFKD